MFGNNTDHLQTVDRIPLGTAIYINKVEFLNKKEINTHCLYKVQGCVSLKANTAAPQFAGPVAGPVIIVPQLE